MGWADTWTPFYEATHLVTPWGHRSRSPGWWEPGKPVCPIPVAPNAYWNPQGVCRADPGKIGICTPHRMRGGLIEDLPEDIKARVHAQESTRAEREERHRTLANAAWEGRLRNPPMGWLEIARSCGFKSAWDARGAFYDAAASRGLSRAAARWETRLPQYHPPSENELSARSETPSEHLSALRDLRQWQAFDAARRSIICPTCQGIGRVPAPVADAPVDPLYEKWDRIRPVFKNALARNGIRDPYQVKGMSDEELLAIRNLGRRGLAEIRRVLA